MFCRFCGAENPDEAAFCKKCGKQLSAMIATAIQETPTARSIQEASLQPQGNSNISCPYCHARGEHCHPIVKTDIKTSGGGYGFWNGCCGLILLGPVGLLCGACGSSVKTKVRNETWWICQKCGKEFISKQSAIERANLSMRTAAIYSLIGSSAVGYSFGDSEISSFWLVVIAILVMAGLWGSIPMSMAESSGLPLDQLLTPEEKSSFRTRFILLCAASILGGLLFGISTIG